MQWVISRIIHCKRMHAMRASAVAILADNAQACATKKWNISLAVASVFAPRVSPRR